MKLVFLINNSKEVGGGGYAQYKFAEYLAILGNEITIFGGARPVFYKNYKLPKNLKLKFRGVFPKLFKGAGLIDRIWEYVYTQFIIVPYLKSVRSNLSYAMDSLTTVVRSCKENEGTESFKMKYSYQACLVRISFDLFLRIKVHPHMLLDSSLFE